VAEEEEETVGGHPEVPLGLDRLPNSPERKRRSHLNCSPSLSCHYLHYPRRYSLDLVHFNHCFICAQ
jgi:hypothetical protein